MMHSAGLEDANKKYASLALPVSQTMENSTFQKISSFIETNLGIKVPPAKKTMIESRLTRRLRAHGFQTYEQYYDYTFGSEGYQSEIQLMIDAVTTNETSFFREEEHFKFLTEKVLPELFEKQNAGPVYLWSVAASTGQEAYTLAMVLEEAQRVSHKKVDYRILATDISEAVLRIGSSGIYTAHQAKKIPLELQKRYCLRSRDRDAPTIRFRPELREKIMFRKLNLMNTNYDTKRKYQIVFCRNVFIYFDRENQRKVLSRLYERMTPGGYLFMGHSENISGTDLDLRSVASAVYQKPDEKENK